ncbi:hypothetical protein [Kocuria sp.]|uniref:hypothetical protein n=1 Tax=Kocuria sp. TaxID=1871328 RepID=UPI0028A84EDC|nr:hypothetical protein [Kocuria sp.]
MPLVYRRIDESFHQVAAAGDVELFADAWLPGGHEVYCEQVKDTCVEAAVLFEGCMFSWAFRPMSRRTWSRPSRNWAGPRWPSG